MNRTAEIVLSVLSVILNLITIFILVIVVFFGSVLIFDPTYEEELYYEYSMDPSFTLEEAESEVQSTILGLKIISGFGWFFIISCIIAIVLAIVGAIKINKNPKVAGILFTIGFIFSGFLTIPGILLLIAAILAFVREVEISKPQVEKISAIR